MTEIRRKTLTTGFVVTLPDHIGFESELTKAKTHVVLRISNLDSDDPIQMLLSREEVILLKDFFTHNSEWMLEEQL